MTLRSSAPRLRSCAMAVMGKASIPGRVKTRLVPPLSADEAAQLNTAFLQDAVANVIGAGASAYVAFGPAGSDAFFREHLPPEAGLIAASLPNFGACLAIAIDTMLEAGHCGACVLNADSPTLPMRLLREATRLLSEPGERAVLGPSEDGGYYLLGLKSVQPHLFENIDWSTERVCAQTRQRAAEAGLPVVLLEPWYDVDDAAALRRLERELSHQPKPDEAAAGVSAAATRSAFARLLADAGFRDRFGAGPASGGAE